MGAAQRVVARPEERQRVCGCFVGPAAVGRRCNVSDRLGVWQGREAIFRGFGWPIGVQERDAIGQRLHCGRLGRAVWQARVAGHRGQVVGLSRPASGRRDRQAAIGTRIPRPGIRRQQLCFGNRWVPGKDLELACTGLPAELEDLSLFDRAESGPQQLPGQILCRLLDATPGPGSHQHRPTQTGQQSDHREHDDQFEQGVGLAAASRPDQAARLAGPTLHPSSRTTLHAGLTWHYGVIVMSSLGVISPSVPSSLPWVQLVMSSSVASWPSGPKDQMLGLSVEPPLVGGNSY